MSIFMSKGTQSKDSEYGIGAYFLNKALQSNGNHWK